MNNSMVLLDCQPGFYTSHDTISVYAHQGSSIESAVQEFANGVWLFDVKADGKANLIIDFKTDAGRTVAELYDDQDGDGMVEYVMVDGRPQPIESDYPTVRVVSLDGWWQREGHTSFNLDILVDGPVRASFNARREWVPQLRNDGKSDYRVHVRDIAEKGRPDLEWRQFYPPFSEDPARSGHYRTEIASNPEGDEVPVTDYVLWPYLGWLELDPPQDYVKDYSASAAPIRIDWDRSRVAMISEFVASRGNPGSFFIYSINRVREGTTTPTNFESPFAFYDLGDVNDGWPDMSIRFLKTLPHEAPTVSIPDHINVVQLAWDQFHAHNWTYSLNLVGNQPIRDVIRFPDFAVNAISPEDLPSWVAEQDWRAATFVEVDVPNYWTSERVYEYSVDFERNVVPYRYLTGLITDPPNEVFEKIDPGFRGEYVLDMDGPARLYFSPVDRRLHLLGATSGVWNLGEGRELRYDSLGTEYTRRWVLKESGIVNAELYLADAHLIYASTGGIRIGELVDSSVPNLLTHPQNHEQWLAMGELVQQQGADEFEPDDFERMFEQAAVTVFGLRSATVSDFRPTPAGFELVTDITTVPPNIDWLAGRRPGTYVISYRDGKGFSARPARPATMELGAPIPVGESATAGSETPITITVRNLGDLDAAGVRVTAYAGMPNEQMQPIGSTRIDIPANESREARIVWVPNTAGSWSVRARIVASDSSGPVAELEVEEVPGDGVLGVLGVQELSPAWLVFAGIIVVAAAVFTLRVGTALAAPDPARQRRHWP